MEHNITPGPRAETGSVSLQEQGLIRNLALDVQEIAGIYKRERGAGRDGTDIPLMFIADDISKLKELGILEKYKGALTKIGADPIIRFAVFSQLNQADQSYEQVLDKFYVLENIRMRLELGEALGLNESTGNPDFEPAAELFKNYQKKYQTLEEPEEQSAPVTEIPQKEPTPEEVSELAARLREAMNPKEGETLGERWERGRKTEEIERKLGEILNQPPEANFEALEKSGRDLEDVNRHWSKMSNLIEDLYKDPAQVPTIDRILSQISTDVMKTYKRYPHSLYYKLRESAGGEDRDNYFIDTSGPLLEWEEVANKEAPAPDELRQALLKRNQAFISAKKQQRGELQKIIDMLNSAAGKEGLKFQESEYGDLELVKSTRSAQAPKGPGVLGRLARVFKRGGKETDQQAKQIIKDLEEADDETILHHYGLMEKLDDISFMKISERGVELAPLFKNGLKPGNLGKLTEFSEDVTKRMEEKGILDQSEHEDNIENIRLILWNIIKLELQTSK